MTRVSLKFVTFFLALFLIPLSTMALAVPDNQHAVYGWLAHSPLRVLLVGSGGVYATCNSKSGSPEDMVYLVAGLDKTIIKPADLIQPDYLKPTAAPFCLDKYKLVDGTQLSLRDVFSQIGWPSVDKVLQARYRNQTIAVKGLAKIDPATYQTQQQAAINTYNQATTSSGPCDWVPNLFGARPHIDICYPLRGLVEAADKVLKTAYANIITQTGSFLWTTPTAPFSDANSQLLTIWQYAWIIVTICIAAVLAWSGLRLMVGQSSNWLTYANATEIIPRVVFGVFAAYYSKEIFLEIITGSNALSNIFSSDISGYVSTQPNNIIDVVLQIVFVFMNILLIIEGVARMAIIYVLFAFSPILLFLASLKETQHFAKNSIVASIMFILLQPAQGAVLDVGVRVLSTVINGSAGVLGTLNFLVAIALMFVTLMMFFSFTSISFGRAGGPLGAAGMGLSLKAASRMLSGKGLI